MNDTITPRLREDVQVRLFDEQGGAMRFIVGVDDRHFLVSPLVAAVLEESRAQSTLFALAARASLRLGAVVSAELASQVLREELLSVCFQATEPRGSSDCPIRFRVRVLSERAMRLPLLLLSRLFTRAAAILVITALVAAEILVAARASEAAPVALGGTQLICAAALTVLGILAHESGHLAACTRFGASHGGMGLGFYWCMPVFYAEVHGAWMLPRLHRAAVDIGGIYFQCAYVVALAAAYVCTGSAAVLEAIVWTHVLMLHTLNPVLKYDGYWLLTDLSGTPNLHARIRESARHVWHAIRGARDSHWPGSRAIALLAAFTGIAALYFSYWLAILGVSIGRSAGASLESWAARDSEAYGLWHATGESAVLALFLVMALGLAFLLARSIHRIGRDSST